jgi:hypothetical protein
VIDRIPERVGEDSNQGRHLAHLDGGRRHAQVIAPMTQDNLSLFRVPRDS